MRQGDVHHRHIQDDHELGAEHDGQGDPGPPGTASRRSRKHIACTAPVDPSGTFSPIRSMRRRQDASMVVWSCDLATATTEHRHHPATTERRCAEAGLRWLTDRWPGGTIRNEAEVCSGYYTEGASVSQPN